MLLLALASYTPTDPSFNTVGHYGFLRGAASAITWDRPWWEPLSRPTRAPGLIGVAFAFFFLSAAGSGEDWEICWMRSAARVAHRLAKTQTRFWALGMCGRVFRS